jgi:hypothetical protein
MEDKPTPEEPKKDFNSLDLSQLEGFSFGTSWTKDAPEQDSGAPRRREGRPSREGGRDDRRDRRGFKKSSGPAGGGGGQRDRRGGDRPPRGQGQDRGRRPGGPRGDRREGGSQRPQGPYISPHFNVTFYPEDVSFTTLAKTIRSSARTFELFDIAKTVIGKNDRFVVVVERKTEGKGEEKKPFYVCLLDGMPFESEEAVMNHVVQNHIERFFTTSEEEVEPPKGSFQVINKCGVTGELLGPPNYHRYNQIVQQHHATRLARMDFEKFSSRIESVRDPEVVEQWLESMKKVIRFTWRGDDVVPVDPSKQTAVEETSQEETPAEDSTPEAEEVQAAPAEETPSPEEAVSETEDAAPVTEDAPVEEPVSDETATEEPAAEETSVSAPAASLVFDSVSDAKVHLISHARDKVIRIYEHSRFHGRILANMPDSEIKRAVMGALERQQRFPLDTANALRGRLRREGFTIFKKGSKGVSYVSAVKRKFRVTGQTFADSINDLINFIEQTPMVKVSELAEKFLGIKPPEAAQPAEGETPSATDPGTVSPFGEDDQPRIKRMQVDLRWLVTEGYVTEFIDGSLFAAAPLPPPKAKTEEKPKVEESKIKEPAAAVPAEAQPEEPAAEAEPAPTESEPKAEEPSAEAAPDPEGKPAEPEAPVAEAPVEEPAPAVESEAPTTEEPKAEETPAAEPKAEATEAPAEEPKAEEAPAEEEKKTES